MSDKQSKSKLKRIWEYLSKTDKVSINSFELAEILTKNKLAIVHARKLCEQFEKDRAYLKKLETLRLRIEAYPEGSKIRIELQSKFDSLVK
jgi:hypothetical protein